MRFLQWVSILGLISCKQIEESKPFFFNVKESDLSWSVNLNDKGVAMFVRNDSILIIDGREFKFISENGTVKPLANLTGGHSGSMLVHYGLCKRTLSSYKCKVALKDSSKVEKMYLSIEGTNSRLNYPTCYIYLREKELKEKNLNRNCALDFNTHHLEVFDIAQFSSTCFVLLYDYTPHELDKAGVKKIGFLDLSKLLKKDGDSVEYLKDKVDKFHFNNE
jgi:hypothetical protein